MRQRINIGHFEDNSTVQILNKLDNYLRYERRFSEINITSIMGSAKHLLTHFEIKIYDQDTANNIEKRMTDKGLKPKTIINRLLVFQYLAEIHGIKLKLKKPKKVKTKKEYLTVIEAKALLDAAASIRDRAIIALFLYTGVRVTSLSCLKISDLDAFHRTLVIRSGTKNYREYTVILSKECLRLLNEWIRIRPNNGTSELFLNIYGEKLDTKRIEVIVKETAKKARIEKRVFPHMLRTTCACNMLKSGVSLTEVSMQLGHTNLESTILYLVGSMDDLKESIDKKFIY
jgi:integrase